VWCADTENDLLLLLLLWYLLQVEHATASRVRDLERQLDAEQKRAEVSSRDVQQRHTQAPAVASTRTGNSTCKQQTANKQEQVVGKSVCSWQKHAHAGRELALPLCLQMLLA
jgi:hypothetical protein